MTLAYQFTATDGDGDPVQTVFHVTVDANNDGVLNAVSSDETVGVTTSTEDIVTTTTTTTTTSYVDDGKP